MCGNGGCHVRVNRVDSMIVIGEKPDEQRIIISKILANCREGNRKKIGESVNNK